MMRVCFDLSRQEEWRDFDVGIVDQFLVHYGTVRLDD